MNNCDQSLTIPVQILILVLVFLILQSSCTSANESDDTVVEQLKQIKLEQVTLNRRVGFLEIENKDQKENIKYLKTQLSKIKQNSAMEKNAYNQGESANGNVVMTRQKRPVRLFPEYILRNKKKDEDKPIIGPPSSCEDLNKMGHTLNAIYMIKALNGSKMNAVFCNFQTDETRKYSSSPYSTLTENKLGFIDVKSGSGVYFYVQAFGNRTIPDSGVLPFDKAQMDIGGGMNLKTGVFTVPKGGTYAFLFSIMKNGFNPDLIEIALRRNRTRIGYSRVTTGFVASAATLQATLQLKKGDRIDLQKSANGDLSPCGIIYCHHFAGWLLEEDLEL